MTLPRLTRDRAGQLLFLALLVLFVAACAAPGGSGAAGSGGPPPTPTPAPAARPGPARCRPDQPLAWLFTPIFQTMFIILVAVYDFFLALGFPAAIGIAIVVLTLDRPDRRRARSCASS